MSQTMGRIGTTQVSVFVEQRILVWMNVPGREEQEALSVQASDV